MTPEQQKEEISKAYVATVAARCGFKVAAWSQDDDCIDTTIGAEGVIGHGTLASPKIDLQLKCTSDQSVVHEGYVSCTLKKKHYNILRQVPVSPKLLVILVLPEDQAEWVVHSIESLILKRCAFWVNLVNEPEAVGETKTVRVPKEQLFSPDRLGALMQAVSAGEIP